MYANVDRYQCINRNAHQIISWEQIICSSYTITVGLRVLERIDAGSVSDNRSFQ